MELTRRHALAAAAGVAAAPLLPAISANADSPMANKQAPSLYRYKVGDILVTVVSDGQNVFKFEDNFIVNAKKEEVAAALEQAYMPPGMMTIYFAPLVINIGGKVVVVDTGNGPVAKQNNKGANGLFADNMVAAGFDPAKVDTVVISHFHTDHVNGLLTADGTPAFPNAEVLVPALEHKYWTDAGEESRSSTPRIADNFKNVKRVMTNPEVAKRLRTHEWDKEVIPGVLAVGTPGHTPGHTSHIVSSGSAKVYVQADVTHAPFLFARHPGWHAFYDHEPVLAEATRRKVYDMLSAEKMMVQGFHYPFPSVAHVEKTASGYQEVPMPWSPVL